MAVSAGTMASSSGRASVAPTPRRKVRRGRASLAMNIFLLAGAPPPLGSRRLRGPIAPRRSARLMRLICRLHRLRPPHLKRKTLANSQHDRAHLVVARRGVAHDLPHGGHVVILDAPTERVGQQLFCQRTDEP